MNRTRTLPSLALVAVLALALNGCRGWTSDKPPVHLNPNMDTQEKAKAFRKSGFFADGLAMRLPVEGTVAQGFLREDDTLSRGLGSDGQPALDFPAGLAVNAAMYSILRTWLAVRSENTGTPTASCPVLSMVAGMTRPPLANTVYERAI